MRDRLGTGRNGRAPCSSTDDVYPYYCFLHFFLRFLSQWLMSRESRRLPVGDGLLLGLVIHATMDTSVLCASYTYVVPLP